MPLHRQVVVGHLIRQFCEPLPNDGLPLFSQLAKIAFKAAIIYESEVNDLLERRVEFARFKLRDRRLPYAEQVRYILLG